MRKHETISTKKFAFLIVTLWTRKNSVFGLFSRSGAFKKPSSKKSFDLFSCLKIDAIIVMPSTSFMSLTALHKKWCFHFMISSVHVTKSAGNFGFGHIYCRNPEVETSVFVQWYFSSNVIILITTKNHVNFIFYFLFVVILQILIISWRLYRLP